MNARRNFFRNIFSVGVGVAVSQLASARQARTPEPATGAPPSVLTPDVEDLPFTLDNGVKVFNLIAEPVKQTIIPGRTFDLWGFKWERAGADDPGQRGRSRAHRFRQSSAGAHRHSLAWSRTAY